MVDVAEKPVEEKVDAAAVNAEGTQAEKPAEKTFTQSELDRVIDDRLKRERKSWETKIEEDRRKAEMTEGEKLKAEREEALKKVTEVQTAANSRLIRAEAKAIAVGLGVKPERVDYALKLADLSAVEVSESGDPDSTAITAAVTAVLNDVPELKAGDGNAAAAGGDFSGASGKGEPITMEWIGKAPAEELKKRMPEVEAFLNRNK